MKKGRRVPPLTPKQIITGSVHTHVPASPADWDEAEQRRTLRGRTLAVGVAQNQVSGLYHTWISLYGTEITSWGVYREQAPAVALAAEIEALFAGWTYDDAAVARMDALLGRAIATSDEKGAVLPDDQVRQILATLASLVQRQN